MSGQDGTSRGHTVVTGSDSGAFASLRHDAPPRAERYAFGRRLRGRVPRSALGDWDVLPGRADVTDQVIQSHAGRLDRLVPVRIGRMISSPYAFLRGAANVHAADFAGLPATGISPVICGDAHLGNFGFYASPERDLVFDLNDFDEARPGAWEWDLRRLTTSVWVAGRQNGSPESSCADAVARCVDAYRQQIATMASSRCSPARTNGSTSTGCTRRRVIPCAPRWRNPPAGPAGGGATGHCPRFPSSATVCG